MPRRLLIDEKRFDVHLSVRQNGDEDGVAFAGTVHVEDVNAGMRAVGVVQLFSTALVPMSAEDMLRLQEIYGFLEQISSPVCLFQLIRGKLELALKPGKIHWNIVG